MLEELKELKSYVEKAAAQLEEVEREKVASTKELDATKVLNFIKFFVRP